MLDKLLSLVEVGLRFLIWISALFSCTNNKTPLRLDDEFRWEAFLYYRLAMRILHQPNASPCRAPVKHVQQCDLFSVAVRLNNRCVRAGLHAHAPVRSGSHVRMRVCECACACAWVWKPEICLWCIRHATSHTVSLYYHSVLCSIYSVSRQLIHIFHEPRWQLKFIGLPNIIMSLLGRIKYWKRCRNQVTHKQITP